MKLIIQGFIAVSLVAAGILLFSTAFPKSTWATPSTLANPVWVIGGALALVFAGYEYFKYLKNK